MPKNELIFYLSLISLLAMGAVAGPNPASCAIALGLVFAYRTADKYFHDTFHDENKLAIVKLRDDYAKIKQKQDAHDLKNAFGPKT